MRKRVFEKSVMIWEKREQIYMAFIVCGAVLTVALMYFRAFYGTELTDEAYYVSEAKEMLNGNIPFAYNNSSKALGFTFILIAIEAIYKLFVPDLEGVFLFTRFCFVTYKVIVCCVVYNVLQRRDKKTHALLAVCMLLPMYGILQNFSYNTIPIYTMLMAGCLLYDVIEQDAPHAIARLIVAGAVTGIACFANPGWGITLIIFSALILIRIKNKKDKMRVLVIFLSAVLAVVLIVIIPIAIQTSFSELWYGFYRLFINPIPMDTLNPNKKWEDVIASFSEPFEKWLKIFIFIFILTLIFSIKALSGKRAKFEGKQYLTFSAATAMLVYFFDLALKVNGMEIYPLWGFSAFCYLIVFGLLGVYKEEKIVYYLAVYQLIYVGAAIILLSSGADIRRFENCHGLLLPILYALLKYNSKLVRCTAALITGVIILSMGYVDFHNMYRDANFHELNYKVESGVYKGIYTTEARARDLPELEEYLNNTIGSEEAYAFRDNVPSAYLMVHTGRVCEISTWDTLQHTYHRNSPAILFDYYRRRNMIPDKIIYVDYGRDENLSIIEPGYRYNDWVNKYYDLIEDIELNETFFHVMVYQYNGTFDGDYQYWIDTYWELVK